MRKIAIGCTVLASATWLGACAPDELPVLVFDTRSALCIDQQGDGACDRAITVPDAQRPLRSDYLERVPYILAGAIHLRDGAFIALNSPGASLTSTRDLGTATILTYDIDPDTATWAVTGKRVHIRTDQSVDQGGEGPTHTAWLVLDYRYAPSAFRVDDVQGVELHLLSKVQVNLPGNQEHNDDRPVMYGGLTVFDAPAVAALAAGMGADNVLRLDTDPLLLEHWLDGSGQKVDQVERIALSVLK